MLACSAAAASAVALSSTKPRQWREGWYQRGGSKYAMASSTAAASRMRSSAACRPPKAQTVTASTLNRFQLPQYIRQAAYTIRWAVGFKSASPQQPQCCPASAGSHLKLRESRHAVAMQLSVLVRGGPGHRHAAVRRARRRSAQQSVPGARTRRRTGPPRGRPAPATSAPPAPPQPPLPALRDAHADKVSRGCVLWPAKQTELNMKSESTDKVTGMQLCACR